MITDEQVNAFINAFELNGGHFLGNNEFDTVRKALEAYEKSKWVKFDVDDESTHPPLGAECIILAISNKDGNTIQALLEFEHEHDGGVFGFDRFSVAGKVTHWQPLPEFKE